MCLVLPCAFPPKGQGPFAPCQITAEQFLAIQTFKHLSRRFSDSRCFVLCLIQDTVCHCSSSKSHKEGWMGTETDPRQPEPHFGCTFVLLHLSPSTAVCSRHDVGRDIRSLSTHNHDVPMLNRTNCNFLYFGPSRQFQEEKAKALQRYRCCHCSSQWPLCRQ